MLNQLNLVVRDMERAAAFYRALGVDLTVAPDGRHASARMPDGFLLELDTVDFVPQWDSAWSGATGGSTVLGFALESREAVDETYAQLTAAGHRGHQRPYDAFWGARYAIVDDPDGNPVGLMSPIDPARRSWPPPGPPPSGAEAGES